MKCKTIKTENPISKHFSEMGKKSWAVRKQQLLRSGALTSKKVAEPTELENKTK